MRGGLQLEGAEGNALGGDVQRPRERKVCWAGGEGLFGGDLRQIGSIVLLGEMREHEMPRAAVENFGIGQKIAYDIIG